MKIKIFFPSHINILIFFISAVVFAFAIDMSMTDDGLRHIAFAANQDTMKSWGEVFPHSLFSTYDPWFYWHKLLQLLLQFVPYDSIHVVINTFSLFCLMMLIYQYIIKEVKYDFASLTYIIVFSIVLICSFRYLMVRPDLLSGLYVMTALLLRNRVFPIVILTLLYGPFYYLFFMYTGSVGLVYMVQKKWTSFFSIFIASLIVGIYFLLQDSQDYLDTVKYILTDQTLRMGLEVNEGAPLFGIFAHLNYFILLPLFLSTAVILIYWKYEYFKSNTLATFLLITSILWLNQHRYFYLFLPLISIYSLSIIVNINKRAVAKFIRRYFILIKRNFSYAKKVPLFYWVAIPYSIVMFAVVFNSNSVNKKIEEAEFFKNEMFDNKVVLLNALKNDVYKGLYHNSTIRFVPSCSIGWFDNSNEQMKDIYIRMQKNSGITESELFSLIKYVKADIYIHYLRNDKQVLDFDKLKKFGIIPKSIYHNRIIFKIKKNKSINHE